MASAATLNQEQIRLAEELLHTEKPKPSFAKQLFFGRFDGDKVLPFPDPGPTVRKAADTYVRELEKWCDSNLDPDWIDRNAMIPDETVAGLGKIGLLGMTIPKENGGMDRSQFEYCKAMEVIGGRCGGTAVFVNAHHSIGQRALVLFGTEEQRERWLAPLARGEQLAAFALTEPEAGSDAANVQTRAVFDPAKNVYRLTGKKQWITNGGIASVLTVMARTEVKTPRGVEDKITAFLVTPDMPGFVVEDARMEKNSIKGTATGKLSFHDVPVPAENILGPLGGGLKVALTVLDFGRLTFGATCAGAAKESTRRAIEHAKTRIQFKRPLAAFGLVKRKLAQMEAYSYAVDATLYLTAGLLDRGEGDFMIETAILKVFASECVWTIVNETMQILGGKSFFMDQPYERMMRDARLNLVGEGANEVLRVFIGLAGMRDVGKELEGLLNGVKKPVSGIGGLLGFAGRKAGQLLATPKVDIRSPRLRAEAAELGSRVKKFGFAVLKCLGKHKEEIIEQQMDVDRIATAVIALYSTTAVLGKLDADLARLGETEAMKKDLAVGKFYCAEAFANFDRAIANLFSPTDAATVAVANQLTGLS